MPVVNLLTARECSAPLEALEQRKVRVLFVLLRPSLMHT